jgi:putative hemolysin
MMRLIILTAALLTAACQPVAATDVQVDQPYERPNRSVLENATPAECATRGGTMKPVGRAQTMQCVVAYADAGKRCTTGSDCQGDCRVEDAPFPAAGASAVGRCQADSQPFGCHATVENGRATAAICID